MTNQRRPRSLLWFFMYVFDVFVVRFLFVVCTSQRRRLRIPLATLKENGCGPELFVLRSGDGPRGENVNFFEPLWRQPFDVSVPSCDCGRSVSSHSSIVWYGHQCIVVTGVNTSVDSDRYCAFRIYLSKHKVYAAVTLSRAYGDTHTRPFGRPSRV